MESPPPKIGCDFTIETARCRLRAPTDADIPHIFSATRHPGFNDGMPWDPPASEADLVAPLQRSREKWAAGTDYSFSIDRRAGEIFLGRISIRVTDRPKIWNIGYWMHPIHQGNGFVTEAAGAIIQFGFQTLGAIAIEAGHATWNSKSRAVLERIGMREVEFLPRGFQKHGIWVSEFRMAIRSPAHR